VSKVEVVIMLELSGELLGVRTQDVPGGVSKAGKPYDGFSRTTLTLFDSGRTYEVDCGREFPLHRLAEMQKVLSESPVRPVVRLDVFAGKYGLTAVDVLELHIPQPVKA
jgi:hypothetical protein